jgi:hypothetical protein
VSTLISETLDRIPDRGVNVASLACGPAQELFDVFDGPCGPDARKRLFATAIDIDHEALDCVRNACQERGLERNVSICRGNLIHLATGRQQIEMPPQDLIYSIGLIDYFGDPFVIRLMDWSHDRLALAGKLVLGNFHPSNTHRAFMDHVIEWRLIHRSEEDMHGLSRASAFKQSCSKIQFEKQRINLFAECVRTT